MFVYLLTNTVNGKQYVGQTTKTVRERFQGHKDRATRTDTHRNPVALAIAKYGHEAFTVETLEECESPEDLDMAERFWLRVYDCMAPKGYNLMTGGNRNKSHSPETRAKLRDQRLGVKFSEQTKARMSAAHSGSRHTEETLAKIRCENHHRAKLDWNKVREMRRRGAQGASLEELSATFSVGKSTVCRILKNQRWIE